MESNITLGFGETTPLSTSGPRQWQRRWTLSIATMGAVLVVLAMLMTASTSETQSINTQSQTSLLVRKVVGPPSKINKVTARQIIDSRGNPTIEVDIRTRNGKISRAAVPSGASVGEFEAVELRDGDEEIWMGRSVLTAVENVNKIIGPAIMGKDACRQGHIDGLMINLDGTKNKSNLGANGILGVSMAIAKACAASRNIPLYQYLGQIHKKRGNKYVMPVPMANIINGGKHAANNIDFQEFMIMPIGADSFSQGLQWITEVFHTLRSILAAEGLATSVGDEGGFAPNLDNEQALDYIMKAILAAGYRPREQIGIALDCAAAELYDAGGRQGYRFWKSDPDNLYTVDDMAALYSSWVSRYPIVSIEDPLDQNDWSGYVQLTKQLGDKVQIVGDDFFVTNPDRLHAGVTMHAANAILIKVNQIGTITETLKCISLAQAKNFGVIASHRSGETEDTFIADLAVGTGAGQIKTGSLSRTDRVAKYNQLIRIEEGLGKRAIWDPDFLHFRDNLYTLVLVRHGESEWNLENKFTGWVDVDLTPQGREEAFNAGEALRLAGHTFDVAYTSSLKRAIHTLWEMLDGLEQAWIPVVRNWRLNERMYGALTGLDKKETVEEYGAQQVQIWRRSYDIPPPPLDMVSPYHPMKMAMFKGIDPKELPETECLKDVVKRALPVLKDDIMGDLKAGKRVLLAAHGNSIRAIVKYLDEIPDDEITDVEIPNGIPLIYKLDKNFKPIRQQGAMTPLNGAFLGDPEVIQALQNKVKAQTAQK